MNRILRYFFCILAMIMIVDMAQANNTQWNVGVKIDPYFASSSLYNRHPPNKSGMRPLNQSFKPQQHSSNLNIIYKAPSYTTYHQNTYMWVNGDPNIAKIESSSYKVITQWQELGLPPPPNGMYWIFENGRYMLMDAQ